MAEHELELTLTWENQKAFKMTAKEDGAGSPKITILEIEEDGHIADLWPFLQRACETYFTKQLAKIGFEMEKP